MKIISAESPSFDGKSPHLMCKKGEIAPVVLLPGDPGRVVMFGEFCEEYAVIASNREYTVGTGVFNGRPVSVCSTGIGAPSAEIAVIELIELGAKALIRVGGTGVIRPEIKCGDMVINTAAIRMGGASNFYAPPEYPAVASYEVVECLIECCKKAEVPYWKGISASVGSFFSGQARPVLGKKFYDDNLMEQYDKLRVINLEMEAETILTLGTLFDVFVGSLCATHANRATDEWLVDFTNAQRQMCQIALETACLLQERYL